jgi:hypothetical protein
MNRRIRSCTVIAVWILLGLGSLASAQQSEPQQDTQAEPSSQVSDERPGWPELIRPDRSPEFDPRAGEPIRPDRAPEFDPAGEPIRPERSPEFDPRAGEPIRPERSGQFDPSLGEPIRLEDARLIDPQTGEVDEPVFRPDELDGRPRPQELRESVRLSLDDAREQITTLLEKVDTLPPVAEDRTVELPSQRRLQELGSQTTVARLRLAAIRAGFEQLDEPRAARQTGRLLGGLDDLQDFLAAYGLVLVRHGDDAQLANDLELDIDVLEQWLRELPELQPLDHRQ